MAKKNSGYIKISRDILHSPIWEASDRFDIRSIWIDLNLRANHTDQTKTQGNQSYILKRGQVTGSLTQFGEWWHMDKDTARRKLLLLQSMGLIYYDSRTLNQTLVTLVKYSIEQGASGLGCDTISDAISDATSDEYADTISDATSEHYKNDKECNKNDKRMNKEKPAAFEDF